MDLISSRQARVHAAIALIAFAAFAAIWFGARSYRDKAEQAYVAGAEGEMVDLGLKLEHQFNQLYRNIRTLALLPGVRKIDRYARNVDADTEETFQQIYNNLADSVSVSEVYIVPADIDPDVIDPTTGKPGEPILMFDHLIVNGGRGAEVEGKASQNEVPLQPEVEYHEYKQYKAQFAWFRQNVPDQSAIDGLRVPMIGGPEVITCDNTVFNKTLDDGDRRGMTFAVPFYGVDGALRGSISAVLLSREIAALLPNGDYALSHRDYGYDALRTTGGQAHRSLSFVQKGRPDPGLVFSRTIELSTADGMGTWVLWGGRANSELYGSADMTNINWAEWIAYLVVLSLAIAVHAITWMDSRHRRLAEQVAAERFSALNQLTAKVSHEIRNPLGAVRNSVFMLRRLAKNDQGMIRQADRAERNIARCDRLIADLLEYTRRDPLIPVLQNLSNWLEELFANRDLPEDVSAFVSIPETPVLATFDGDKLGRAVLNIFQNATEAVVASQRPGRVLISLEHANGQAIIKVTDDGFGIDDNLREQVFEPLFTTKSFGAGLGLPVARDVIGRHGGTITYQRTEANKTCFVITLPLADGMPTAMAA